MAKAWRKVPLKIPMHNRVLHQDFDQKTFEIKKKCPVILTRKISYRTNKPTREEVANHRKYNKDRPRKSGARDARH